jgi:hypothetical protein
MRAFRTAIITLEIGFLMAALCGFIIAASDNIAARRKTAEQVKAYNESIRQMEESAKRLRQTQAGSE